MRCSLCKKPLRKTTTMFDVKVGAETVKVEVPAMRCSGCGEVFTEYQDMRLATLVVAEAVIRAGRRTGAAFRFLRHVLGMRANELAEVMGTTPETISRWERGKRRIDLHTWTVLALLLVGRLSHEEIRLEKLAKGDAAGNVLKFAKTPRPLPERIRLAS